jgi:hypothetical protein
MLHLSDAGFPDTCLELQLGPIHVLEDPWAGIRAKGAPAVTDAADNTAALANGVAPTANVTPPHPPLQPCHYHFEVESCDGPSLGAWLHHDATMSKLTTIQIHDLATAEAQRLHVKEQQAKVEEQGVEAMPVSVTDDEPQATIAAHDDPLSSVRRLASFAQQGATVYCSVPCKLEPPSPPEAAGEGGTANDAAAATTPKGSKAAKDDKKPAPPAKGAKGGKAGGKPATPPPQEVPETTLVRGALHVMLGMHANVRCRDWLRNGEPPPPGLKWHVRIRIIPTVACSTLLLLLQCDDECTSALQGCACVCTARRDGP